MQSLNNAARLLPLSLNSELLVMPTEFKDKIEEIRLRAGSCMTVLIDGKEKAISPHNKLSIAELEDVLECATNASFHAFQRSLSKGYVNVEGGIRLGVCGTAIIKDGEVSGIRNLSSLSIRIPHEVPSCAEAELKQMLTDGLCSILIASPPGGGKTTCLRSFVRRLSDIGYRVSLADERGEIAAVTDGQPQFDIGSHTDVMSDAPKADAAMILLRAMNPQVLAMDEISSHEDIDAVFTASGCGVKLLATAHASSFDDLYKRDGYKKLLDRHIFDYCLFITNCFGKRTYMVRELD